MKKAIIGVICLSLVLVVAGWGCSEDDTNENANTAKDINEGLDEFTWENVNENENLNENENTNQAVANENVNLGVEEAEPTEEAETGAGLRDLQRVMHVRIIQGSLINYKEANGHYPDTSNDLIPDYLASWPVNPTPGGADYVYTPIGSLPAQYYDLSYELEVGAEGITEGVHIANPDGIAVP